VQGFHRQVLRIVSNHQKRTVIRAAFNGRTSGHAEIQRLLASKLRYACKALDPGLRRDDGE